MLWSFSACASQQASISPAPSRRPSAGCDYVTAPTVSKLPWGEGWKGRKVLCSEISKACYFPPQPSATPSFTPSFPQTTWLKILITTFLSSNKATTQICSLEIQVQISACQTGALTEYTTNLQSESSALSLFRMKKLQLHDRRMDKPLR